MITFIPFLIKVPYITKTIKALVPGINFAFLRSGFPSIRQLRNKPKLATHCTDSLSVENLLAYFRSTVNRLDLFLPLTSPQSFRDSVLRIPRSGSPSGSAIRRKGSRFFIFLFCLSVGEIFAKFRDRIERQLYCIPVPDSDGIRILLN